MSSVLAAGAIAMGACAAGSAYEYEAYDEPPPPQQEVIEDRPGYVYVHGNWYRNSNNWAWRTGHYEPVRSGYAYQEGAWARGDGNRWRYKEGNWVAHPQTEDRGNVIIRDHRQNPPANVPPGTVVVPSHVNQ